MAEKKKTLAFFLFLLPFATLLRNYIAMQSGCFHALDLGIYQQAVMDLAYSNSWNPENTIRGIRIFADHFDPIILVAALVQRLAGPQPWVLLLVEFGFYWAGGWIIWVATRDKKFQWKIILLMLWFFNEGISVALRYPVHPTTWSCLPILLLVRAFKKEDQISSLVLMNILCLFKEYFPFGMLMYGIYAGFFRRNYKMSALILLNAGIWIGFDFFLRQRIFPEAVGYGGKLLAGIDQNPFVYLVNAFVKFEWKASLLATFPILMLLIPSIYYEQKKWWLLGAFFYFLPIFAIQFLFGTIRFQYGGPIFAALVSGVVWSDGNWITFSGRKPLWVACWVMMIYAAGDSILRAAEVWVPSEVHCRFSLAKWDEFEALQKYILQLPPDSKLLATGGMVPVILRPNQKVYQLNGFSKIQSSYDVLILGRNHSSDLYLTGKERVEKVIQSCRPFATHVVFDSDRVFVALGKFDKTCLAPYF
jgi:hypothetical protein